MTTKEANRKLAEMLASLEVRAVDAAQKATIAAFGKKQANSAEAIAFYHAELVALGFPYNGPINSIVN